MLQPTKLIFTVTTDLNHDQRMIRICTSLHQAGYDVTIIGVKRNNSKPLIAQPYKQVRLPVFVNGGKFLYGIYNIRLFFYLLFCKADALVAIDLDSILPVYWISRLKGIKRVYDAHEIFTEMQEVNERKWIKKMWEWIGQYTIPRFPKGYTIGKGYADYFKEKYSVSYDIVRNASVLRPFEVPLQKDKIIYYQGAVNKGRAFEQLIPAMQMVTAPLVIAGSGNFANETQALIQQYGLEGKVTMLGFIAPERLRDYTAKAYIGITLFDDANNGLSNKLSLANRYFDYMHHGVPQLCCDFPEYHHFNDKYEIAYLLPSLTPESIAEGLNKLLNEDDYYQRLSDNAMKAREALCWQMEEKTLLAFYNRLFEEK